MGYCFAVRDGQAVENKPGRVYRNVSSGSANLIRLLPLYLLVLGEVLSLSRCITPAEDQKSVKDSVIALAISPNGKQVIF